VSSGAVDPCVSLYRLDAAVAGVAATTTTAGGRSLGGAAGAAAAASEAARLAGLRLPDAVVVRLLTALGRAVAHPQTARTLGPGQVASLGRAWADVRVELQRRAANAAAFAAAAGAAVADARLSTASAARLLAAGAAAEAARGAALLAAFDSACARPTFDALIKQGLWLADPGSSGHQAAAAAARARERLGLPSASDAAAKSGAAPAASAADAAADDAAEAAASATAAASGRAGRALPSRDRLSAAMGAARAQARAAVADGAADADGDERDAAELAELMEADDGDGGGDALLSSARAAEEARAASAAAAASRPRFSPLEGEANLALATTFTLHDAVELLHAVALGYPAASSSAAAAASGAAPPPSSADSHPGLQELFVKTARWIGALEAQYDAAVEAGDGGSSETGADGAGGSGGGTTPWKRSLRDLSGPDAVRLAQAFAWAAPPREAGRVLALLARAAVREHALWDGGRGSVITVDRDGIDDDDEVVDVAAPRGSLPPGVTERYGLPPLPSQSGAPSRGGDVGAGTPAFDAEPSYSAPEWRGAARGAARAGGPLAHRVRGTGGGAGSAASLGATPLLVAREGSGSGGRGGGAGAVPIGSAVPSWVRDKGLVGPRSRLHTTRGSWAGRLLGHTPTPALLALVKAVAVVLPANGLLLQGADGSSGKRLDKTALLAWRDAVAGGAGGTAAPADLAAPQQQQQQSSSAALLARWEAVRAAYDALPPELTLPGGAYHGLPAVALAPPQHVSGGGAVGLSGRAAVERVRRLEGLPTGEEAGDGGDPLPRDVRELLAMVAARVASRPSEVPADRLARTLALAAGRAGGALIAQPAATTAAAAAAGGAPPPPLARLVSLGAAALLDDASAGARFLPTRTHARLTAAVGAAVAATLPTAGGAAAAADVDAALRRAEPFHRHLHDALGAVFAAAAARLASAAAGRSLPVHDALLVAATVPSAAALAAGATGSSSRNGRSSSGAAAARLPAQAAALLAAAAPTLAVAAPARCAAALAALAPTSTAPSAAGGRAAPAAGVPVDVRSTCNVLASAMTLRVAAVQAAAAAAAVAAVQPAAASTVPTVVALTVAARTRRAAAAVKATA
jgi:trimeric autotransporter adhesin